MRHLKSYRANDYIDLDGSKCKVLGRAGDIIFRSEFGRYDIAAQRFFTWQEAEKMGWKLVWKDGRVPIPTDEAEKMLMNMKITPKRKKK